MNVKAIIKDKAFERLQKKLRAVSRQAVQKHFSQGHSVHEQIDGAVYEVFPNGQRVLVDTVCNETGDPIKK